jgi:CRP-like cAMP-binding protein
LLKIPFFSKLTFEEFSKLAAKAELRALGPGERLASEGETPYHMFVVTEGEISIRKEVDFAS